MPPHIHTAPAAGVQVIDLLVRGVARGARHMPERWWRGAVAGRFGSLERGWRKPQALANLKLFLGDAHRPAQEWQHLWEAHLRHVGLTVSEFLSWQRLSTTAVQDQLVIRGAEHLRAACRARRGAMLFACHLGNFLSLAPALAHGEFDVCLSGQHLPIPCIDECLHRFAARFGIGYVNVGHGNPATVAAILRRGGVFGTFVDVSMAGRRDEWLPFGCAETNVSLGPALLALRHRVPVVCVSCYRVNASQHAVTFHPPLVTPNDVHRLAGARRLTAQALALVAAGMHQRPEQWWQWDWVPLRPPRSVAGEFD